MSKESEMRKKTVLCSVCRKDVCKQGTVAAAGGRACRSHVKKEARHV